MLMYDYFINIGDKKMAKMRFGDVEEVVVKREEFPLDKAREYFASGCFFPLDAFCNLTLKSFR